MSSLGRPLGSGLTLRSEGLVGRALFVVGAVAASLVVTVALRPEHALAFFGATALVALVAWFAVARNYRLTLAVLLFYLAVIDGYVKNRTGSAYVTLVRDALLYAIAVGVGVRLVLRRTDIRLPPLTGWVLFFVGLTLVELANPNGRSMLHSLGAIRPHLEFVVLFFFGFVALRSPRHIRVFLLLVLLGAAINGIVSYVQSGLSPDQLASWGPGYASKIKGTGDVAGRVFVDTQGTQHLRPFGLGADAGFAGSMALLAVPAALAFLGLAGRRRGPAVAAGLLGMFVVVGVATSASRTSVLGSIAAALAFAGLSSVSRRLWSTFISLAIGTILAFALISFLATHVQTGVFDRFLSIAPGKVFHTTFEYRKGTYQALPGYLSTYPLGAGLGSVGPAGGFAVSGIGGKLFSQEAGRALNGESQVSFMLLELGVAGVLVWAYLTIRLLGLALRRIRRVANSEMRTLLAALAAPLFGITATAWAGPTTGGSPFSPYFWFVGGVLVYWLIVAPQNGALQPAVQGAESRPGHRQSSLTGRLRTSLRELAG